MNANNNTRQWPLPRWIVAVTLIALAATIPLATLVAQSGASEWPTTAPYDSAIHAFDLALTKAAHDPAFRARLLDPKTAKDAVAEVGNIRIPADRVIVFYESESASGMAAKNPFSSMARDAWDTRSSEKVHVFLLPKPTTDTAKQFRYEDYFMCCYDYWKRSP